jgi:hypothetical protein
MYFAPDLPGDLIAGGLWVLIIAIAIRTRTMSANAREDQPPDEVDHRDHTERADGQE